MVAAELKAGDSTASKDIHHLAHITQNQYCGRARITKNSTITYITVKLDS